MPSIIENFTLTPDLIVSIIGIIVTALIAIIGGIYTIATRIQKYELTENYRKELLQWYSSVVTLMIKIIHFSESGEFFSPEFETQKVEMLSQLSAFIEVGRFYFPNIITGDGHGARKPSAYRGHRHANLSFMMRFYQVASAENGGNTARLWELERKFTSVIFEMIDPRKRNKSYSKYTAITIPKGLPAEEFISAR